jgi:hypothetical protein
LLQSQWPSEALSGASRPHSGRFSRFAYAIGNDRYLRMGAVRQIVSNGHQPFKDVADPNSSNAAGVGVDDDVRPAVRLAVEVRIHLAFSAAV